MYISAVLLLAAATLPTRGLVQAQSQTPFQSSPKRGLVFVPSKKAQLQYDNQVWVEGGGDLTWYYNYQSQPSAAYANRTQEDFEFVPMLWNPSNTFYDEVKALVDGGRNVSHVLGYNEPDGTHATGGSQVDPRTAATNWIAQMEPLRKMGIKVGAPAVTGSPAGLTWLEAFFNSCAEQGTNCTVDFIPLHWYGDFAGLASHMGLVNATYPNLTQWITEYTLSDQPLDATQDFFRMSAEYFDRLPGVERYAYFGAFRSDVSNVGPNAAMLTQDGKLTDIGSWYLGGAVTGNVPKGGALSRQMVGPGWVAAVAVVVGFLAL